MKVKKSFFKILIYCLFILPITFSFTNNENSLLAKKNSLTYPIVDTGQDQYFNNFKKINFTKKGKAFHGQDAQYRGNHPKYRDNSNGTVTDLVTGLMWQKSYHLKRKMSFKEAVKVAKKLKFAGYSDWRLPTIRELYSLIDFRGFSTNSVGSSVPYINTDYFNFDYGDIKKRERLIDAQYWSSTEYVSTTMGGNATVFGVNFADGRIKGYEKFRFRSGRTKTCYVYYVRGNSGYGKNKFIDNRDGTITDSATGLTWMKNDSKKKMNWKEALKYAENLKYAKRSDWRLPNAKELQSIVDYSRSPSASKSSKRTAAIDPMFNVTETESWYWTSTTHLEHGTATAAVYISFGRAFGYMGPSGRKHKLDVHGAGAQRSDPKSGNPKEWAEGRGPQGDEIRIYNYVRCVRGGAVKLKTVARINKKKYPYNTKGYLSDNLFNKKHKRSDRKRGRPGFVEHLDRNGDGKVSRSEFDDPEDHFDVLDKNRDGFLSEDEAPRFPPRRERMRGREGRRR